jgi:polar amino acid transport system substrate-binding protein
MMPSPEGCAEATIAAQRRRGRCRAKERKGTQSFNVLSIVVLSIVACLLSTIASPHPVIAESAVGEPSKPTRRVVLRFLTTDDFPPFNFVDEFGSLTGFNVLLARAICQELALGCDVAVRPWRELFDRLQRGDADAIIAGHAVTADALRRVDFTQRYFHTPARFAVRKDWGKGGVNPADLEDRRIGVAEGTAHAAYLESFYRFSRIVTYPSPELARDALRTGEVDALFDDGVSLSIWLNGWLSRKCCEFRGGPYVEPKYFGDGIAIALRHGDPELRHQLNEGLAMLRRNGRLRELVDRFFPVAIY